MGDVKIEFRKKDTEPWVEIATVPFNSSPYTTWAPAIDSITDNLKTAQIKITDSDNSEVTLSSGSFEIEGKLTLDAPIQANLMWPVATNDHEVKWTPRGTYGPIKIEYSTNGFTNETQTHYITSVDNSADNLQKVWEWDGIPNDISDNVKIRIAHEADPDVKAINPNPIKIVGSIDAITAPNTSGIVWSVGETNKVISWTQTGNITNVSIGYKTSATGGYTSIVGNDGGHIAGGNSYAWTTPVNDENSEDCYVRVSDIAHPNEVFKASTVPFSIRPVITISAPTLGQNIEVGSLNNTVIWNINSSKVTKVDIYYSKSGLAGPFDKLISSSVNTTQGSNTFTTWGPVGDDISGDVVIKVRDKSNDIVNDFVYGLSPSFDIIGKLVVNEPHLNEDLASGSAKTISWTKNGTLGNVKIYYFHDGAYEYLDTVDSNSYSSWNWASVPAQIENNSTIKVVDADTEGTEDEVKGISANFNIIGHFSLTDPPATLSSGAAYTILWNNYGLLAEVPNAKLEFYDGDNWHNIDYKTTNTGIVTNSGSYSWTVPNDVRAPDCKFRISDSNNANAGDDTQIFEIRPVIDVTAPAATAKWLIGTQAGNNIAWSIIGPVPTVKIEYSKNNGSNYTWTITSSVAGNASPFEWNIPANQDIITTHTPGSEQKARIKVSDTSLGAIYDESNLFMVKGSITVNSPSNSSPALKVSEISNIEWTTPCAGASDMGDVKIQFRKSDTEAWSDIVTVAFNSSPYTSWAPAIDGITNNAKTAKIRITDADNAEVFDDSDGFEVEGKIVLNSPIESNLMWQVGSDNHEIIWTPTGTFSPIKIEYSKDNFASDLHTIGTVANSAHNTPRTWAWDDIPDDISDTVKIRVSHENDPDVKAQTSNPIKIVGSLEVTGPETAGIVWYVGETNKVISWDATGNITNVNIDYKTAAAGSYSGKNIVTDDGGHIAGSNSYTWTTPVPDEKSEDCYIRVSDVAHPNDVFNVSTVPFSIRPVIAVSAPTLGQNIEVGSTNNTVTWNINSSKVNKVDVYYSKNGLAGPFDKLISSGVNTTQGNNTFTAWGPVGDEISGDVVIKVRDKSNDVVNDFVYGLSASLDIIGKIVVNEPHANEDLNTGASKTISWSKNGTLGNIKLYYYHDGAYEYIYTVDSDNYNSYNWTPIPSQIENNSTIKIVDENTEGTEDEVKGISGQFDILGSFVLTEPPATLSSGQAYTVLWNNFGFLGEVPNAKLEFYDGDNWHNIDYKTTDTGVVPNTGSYSWSVPVDVRAPDCQFRISDANNSAASDSSNAFEVRPVVDVTAPTSIAKWTIGTQSGNNIVWTATGPVPTVKIEYSKDNGSNYTYTIESSVAGNSSPYQWNIPTNQDIITTHGATPNKGRIKVSDTSLGAIYDESALFMVKGSITVSSPSDASPALKVLDATNATITWSTPCAGAADMGDVIIQFSKTGSAPWTDIATVGFETSPYTLWTPPIDSITSNVKAAKIKITDVDNTEVTDDSDQFEIEGKLNIDEPVGSGFVWQPAVQHDIKWTPTGTFSAVKVEYSTNAFANESQTNFVDVISNSAHNTQKTWQWPVPPNIGDNVAFRISDNADPNVFDISGTFKIANIDITYPQGGQQLVCETTEHIDYTVSGSVEAVTIEYSTGFDTQQPPQRIWQPVVSNYPATPGPNSYTPWTVPLDTSTQARVRVKHASALSEVKDETPNFVIRGGFSFIHPKTVDSQKERWLSASNKLIEWNTLGNIGQVYIDYRYKNNLTQQWSNWAPVNNGSAISNQTNSYLWQPIPNIISNDVEIRITDTNDSAATATTDTFVIHGSLTLTQPNGPDSKLKAGQFDTDSKIKWTMIGPIPTVDLYISTNGDSDANYTQFVNVQASLLEYSWQVPTDVRSNNCFIKIKDHDDAQVEDKSDLAFWIMDNIQVTAPESGDQWTAGETKDITWTSEGLATAVDIKYCKEPPYASWTTIQSGVTNSQANTYPWPIPLTFDLSHTYRIRISDANATYSTYSYGTSPDFSIQGGITVISPNGGTGPGYLDREIWKCNLQYPIKWSSKGNITAVDIYYSADGGAWQDIALNWSNTGAKEYPWTIPITLTAENVLVRVKDHNTLFPDVLDVSDHPFKIVPRIVIEEPDLAEVWDAGTTATIMWTKYGPSDFDTVKIEYAINNPDFVDRDPADPTDVKIINASKQFTGAVGTHDWSIPAEAVGFNNVRIRISKPDDADVKAISDTFIVRAKFTSISPNGGQKWILGDTQTISWSKTGITYSDQTMASQAVKLMLYKQSSPTTNTIINIAPSEANGGSYPWTIPTSLLPDFMPQSPSYQADLVMRVADPNYLDPNDTQAYRDSATPFKIMPRVTVTSPIANEQWFVDDTNRYIRWTVIDTQPVGTLGNVSMFFSKSGGAAGSWVNIAGSSVAATTGEWLWPTVPNEISSQLKIKVASNDDADVYGVAPYTINPVTGKPDPNSYTTAPYAKISSRFTIDSGLTGQEHLIGDTVNVTWTNTGSVDKVDLTYSTDDFATESPLLDTAGQPATNINNAHTFAWKVPDIFAEISDSQKAHTVKIRVKSHADADAYSITGDFRIKGNIWIKAPVLDDSWRIGQGYEIKWGWKGTMPTVKITYSRNGLSGPFNNILENYGTPDDGIVGNGAGAGGDTSEHSYTWIIPDPSCNDTVIRISDTRLPSESDIVATSQSFKMRGYIKVLAPMTANERMAVASTYRIRWEWGATIPNVKILLSTNGDDGPFNPIDEDNNPSTPSTGIVPNGSGVGGPGSEAYYDWIVQNNISPNCKIRVIDPAVPTIVDPDYTSNVFKIQGTFTLITPQVELNDNKTPLDPSDDFYECRWITNEKRNITWTTFGTIPNVDLTYAKDFDEDGDIDDADFANEVILSGTQSGNNFANNGSGQSTSYLWDVPDIVKKDTNNKYEAPTNIKVRVYDANDHEVYAGGPVAAGGVNTLNVDYAKIKWDIRNLITNERIKGLKVVEDTPTPWIAEGLASPITHEVPAGRWTAEWSHKDFGPISESYLVGLDEEHNVWLHDRTIARTMESLVVHIWRAYSEFSYNVEDDKLDITSWLERDGSLVPGSLIIDVKIYDGMSKIKRKTILVDEGANPDSPSDDKFLFYNDILDEYDTSGGVKMWIGDRLNDNGTPDNSNDDFEEHREMVDVINEAAEFKVSEMSVPPNFSGFFQQNWTPTPYSAGGTNYDKLTSGKVYTVATYVALKSGANFTTPVSFTVTIPQTMAAVEDAVTGMVATVNSVLDKPISQVETKLTQMLVGEELTPEELIAQGGIKKIVEDKLDSQTVLISDATNTMKTTVENAISSFETSVEESLVTLKSGADQAVAAGQELEATAKKYSWKASVSPNPALTGDKITLQCQGQPDLSPMLDIYSWDNKTIINDIILTQSEPGLYSYEFTADSRFTAGKSYTYIITEQTTGGMVTGSGTVESMGLTAVAGLAAAAPEAERAAKKALDAIKSIESVLISGDSINIAVTLKNLKESVDALPETFAKEGPASRVTQVVSEISDRIKKLAGDEGYNMGELLEKTLSSSPTVKEIRAKTDEINGAVDVLGNIMESKFGGVDEPIIVTSVNPGSVKFRIVALNPSKIKTQKTKVKYYLPAEVKPKDVSDTSGLELEYDSEKSIYYVYKSELELSPGEMHVFEVEVEDIWFVPDKQLADLKNRTNSIMDRLKENTQYYEKAKEIADTIYPRTEEISATQADEAVSREQHIGIYRQNLLTIEQIKEDIARMEKILVTAGGPPAPDMLAKTKIKADEPSKTMTWMVIFIITIFTGLLAAVLFFTWHRQSRIGKDELLAAKKSAFPEPGQKEEGKEPNEG